ncbi:MAG TPA: hypothetical protein VK866_09875, partial [Acidimicrobiales bacterium]|nr:hypothetical protein [Acidimicrobiales bacterium]
RGGATPWRWAESRLTARLAQVIGQHHRPLDEARLGDEPVAVLPAGLDEAPLITLARLAAHDARCALLLDALAVAVSERDADVWLRYRQQQQQGDPSPARTVAGEVGLQPDSVRQIATRGRRRLADVVGADERFAPLTDLALLEPPGTGRSAA